MKRLYTALLLGISLSAAITPALGECENLGPTASCGCRGRGRGGQRKFTKIVPVTKSDCRPLTDLCQDLAKKTKVKPSAEELKQMEEACHSAPSGDVSVTHTIN